MFQTHDTASTSSTQGSAPDGKGKQTLRYYTLGRAGPATTAAAAAVRSKAWLFQESLHIVPVLWPDIPISTRLHFGLIVSSLHLPAQSVYYRALLRHGDCRDTFCCSVCGH